MKFPVNIQKKNKINRTRQILCNKLDLKRGFKFEPSSPLIERSPVQSCQSWTKKGTRAREHHENIVT